MDRSSNDFDDNLNQQERKSLIARFENMLRAGENLYFDHKSLEKIIEYYDDKFEIDKADKVADIALSLYPFSAFFMLKKAEYLHDNKLNRKALEFIEKALVYDPADIKIYLLKADIFKERGEFENAIEALEEAELISDNVEFIDLQLEKADVYHEAENKAAYLNSLEKVLKLEPKNEEAQQRYIVYCELEDENDRAIAFLNKLTDLDPYNCNTWQHLGNAYANLELFEKAIEAYSYGLAIDDKILTLHKDTGIAYYELKEFDKAIQSFKTGLEIDRKDDECLYYIGKCHYDKQGFKKAIYFLQSAVKLDESYEQAWHQLALTYNKLDNSNAAFDAIKSALNFDELNEKYNLTAANICFALGNFRNALFYFNKIKDKDTTDEEMWYEMIDNLLEFEETKAAIDLLNQVSDDIKTKAKWNYFMAISLIKNGKKQKSIDFLENGLASNFELHSIIFDYLPYLRANEEINQLISIYKK